MAATAEIRDQRSEIRDSEGGGMDGEDEGGGPRLSKRFGDKGGEVDYKTTAGTAWSHSYLNQKPWHPLSYPNQRRKWIAEQSEAQRRRRSEEVAREVLSPPLFRHIPIYAYQFLPTIRYGLSFQFFFWLRLFAVCTGAGVFPSECSHLQEGEREGLFLSFFFFLFMKSSMSNYGFVSNCFMKLSSLIFIYDFGV